MARRHRARRYYYPVRRVCLRTAREPATERVSAQRVFTTQEQVTGFPLLLEATAEHYGFPYSSGKAAKDNSSVDQRRLGPSPPIHSSGLHSGEHPRVVPGNTVLRPGARLRGKQLRRDKLLEPSRQQETEPAGSKRLNVLNMRSAAVQARTRRRNRDSAANRCLAFCVRANQQRHQFDVLAAEYSLAQGRA